MAKKKKSVKKPATKKSKAKVKRPASKKAAKKAVKEPAKKKRAPRRAAPDMTFMVSPELDARLQALADSMGKSLDEILLQALTEFADTWEDHQRTIAVLAEGDDRIQLVVPQE
jgi:predicted transcriptional regulator